MSLYVISSMSRLKLHWPFTLFLAFCALVLSGLYPENSSGQRMISDEERLEELMLFFEEGYDGLDIPRLTLSYQDNLNNVGDLRSLNKQLEFFQSINSKLQEITKKNLPPALQLEYAIIDYETTINIERIDLSKSFISENIQINDMGLYHQKHGPDWYLYFTRKWTSDRFTADQITEYGLSEVKRIQTEMNEIKKAAGLSNFDKFIDSEQFKIYDEAEVERLFKQTKSIVDRNLFLLFPDFENLPDVRISRGTNSQLVQTPGYYSNNTFYYNLLDQPFDVKTADWLFIHEGNPGHHFHLNYESTIDVLSYRENLTYGGFREGWAAYVEDLGKQLGLYRTSFNYYSKLEWDLIRSTRLVLDVGINYHGWTDKEALSEWKKHIKNQDNIGKREITRMRRWPAQVLTYKMGSKVMKEWSHNMKKQKGKSFNLKDFHTTLLSQRSIPVILIDHLFAN